jgi:hypothetical protein
VSEVLTAGATSFNDTLAVGGPYYYRVRSVNANGTSLSATLVASPQTVSPSGIVSALLVGSPSLSTAGTATIWFNKSGTWSAAKALYLNNAGTWITIKSDYKNIGGTWVQVY